MKNLFILFIILLPLCAIAQKTHTVGAKETLFSIGRLYSVHPRELAAYNNIPFETGLTIGQVLKIPAKKTMAPVGEAATTPITAPVVKKEPVKTVPAEKKPTKTGVAVYHTVAKKEGLYGISKKYNVTIDDIKKWNQLATEGLSEGMQLIVGYKGPQETSEAIKNVPEKKETPVAQTTEAKPIPVQVLPPAQKVVKQEAARTAGNFGGGIFKPLYNEQVANKNTAEEKGMAGIFKSTSGWEDGKYYCLHNSAPAGSIVKITNNTTRKTVYAKVLDLIPDLKQNSSVIIRISNAAAAELGAGITNFDCTINF
jgi:LysM repeat protein